MTVKSLTPDLMVEDVAATVEWYERVFDAEVVATLPTDPDSDPWWAQVPIDEAPLMFQARESLEGKLPGMEGQPIGGSVAFYVDVDAEALHEHLVSAGVEITRPPHETDFGWRQFSALDPNGYTLWFGEQSEAEAAEEIGRRYRTYHDDLTDDGSGRPGDRSIGPPTGGGSRALARERRDGPAGTGRASGENVTSSRGLPPDVWRVCARQGAGQRENL